MSVTRTFSFRFRPHFERAHASVLNDARRHLGDGGYARVIDFEPGWVMKLTCCEASQALLEELYQRGKLGRTPGRLPMVRACLGLAGSDQDGFTHKAYIVERLFAKPLSHEAPRTRLALHSAAATLRGWDLVQASRCHPRPALAARQLHDDFKAFGRAATEEAEDAWATAVEVLQKAATVLGPDDLDSLLLLERLAARKALNIDICTGGNILFSAWGEPILADPVAVAAPGQTLRRPTNRGVALVGELLRGTPQDYRNLPRYWTIGRYRSANEARAAKEAVEGDRQYRSARLLRWWSEEHLATLRAA